MKRTANAVWQGSTEGSGTMTTPSGVMRQQPYSVKNRFEDESGTSGTNPEELIAAAHAGCFSMALGVQLSSAGFTADEIRTDATLSLEQEGASWTIRSIHLDVVATIPGIDQARFLELAEAAKQGCPVSKVLNAEITMDARLG